ncbi:hypothetical protein MJD09_21090 [bacterium]|nr:hypothetical protein [bacterium]
MTNSNFLNDFAKEVAQEKPPTEQFRAIGWEEVVFTLVGVGLKAILPELKEWIRLGTTAITVKRLEIKKRLTDYAREKKLDLQEAEKAAGVIADKITEENVEQLVEALENQD